MAALNPNMNPHSPIDATSTRMPAIAAWLGGLGLIPFIAMTLVWIMGGPHLPFDPGRGLLGYGAVILSFLGGIHWGIALRPGPSEREGHAFFSRNLVVGVIPSIVGWGALLCPMRIAIALLCTGFILQLWVDLRTISAGHLPSWFARLRIALTTVVLASLLAAGLK